MIHFRGEQGYLTMLDDILNDGEDYPDRTGTGCRGLFGHQLRFDLAQGFPLLTTKKLFTKGIIAELLWFLAGDTNNKTLAEQNVHIWDEWADPETGDLGPIYGKQWRSWTNNQTAEHVVDHGTHKDTIKVLSGANPIDQISDLVELIKKDPYSRRQIVTAWNPAEIKDMRLPPCHCMFQTKVSPSGKLNLHLLQRSCDSFLGVPFNIASYALLLCILADQTGHERGEFVWTGVDVHIYSNHFEQVKEQLSREPRPLPGLEIDPAPDIFSYTLDHFHINNYNPHPAIKADVAV